MMRWPRVTIARSMALTAALALNIALVRAFIVQEMFCGVILIFVVLQLGLWRLYQGRGRTRRFWIGFEIGGVAATLALVACEVVPESNLNRLQMAYMNAVLNLAFGHLPASLADDLDVHDDLLLATIYFVPQMVAAGLGGAIALGLGSPARRPVVP